MKVIKRVVTAAWQGVTGFVYDLATNLRGLTLLCLATVGAMVILTGFGATSMVATAGAVAGTWLLAI